MTRTNVLASGLGSLHSSGQCDGEGRPLARDTGVSDSSAVGGDNLLRDCQSQARSRIFGGSKRFKNIKSFGNAHSCVTDLDRYLRSRTASADGERTAVRHRLDSILAEVEQYLCQLLLVSHDYGYPRGKDLFKVDISLDIIGHLGLEDFSSQRGKRGRLEIWLLRASQRAPSLEK